MISSRTPEGEWNCCPVCQADVKVEPSRLFGDATCPVCGGLLLFLAISGDARLYTRDEGERIERQMSALIAEQLGIDPHAVRDGDWAELGIDSLDLVELMMEFEEEL